MCDWFVDIKSSIHFKQDKTNQLFGKKLELFDVKALGNVHNGIKIKHSKGEYLSGESIPLNTTDKVNFGLKFLHRQNHFLTPLLHRLFCDALTHSLSTYPS